MFVTKQLNLRRLNTKEKKNRICKNKYRVIQERHKNSNHY